MNTNKMLKLRARLRALNKKSFQFWALEMVRASSDADREIDYNRKNFNSLPVRAKQIVLFDITKSLVEMDRKQIDATIRRQIQIEENQKWFKEEKAKVDNKIHVSAWFNGDDTLHCTYF